jgi:hypothetical protein
VHRFLTAFAVAALSLVVVGSAEAAGHSGGDRGRSGKSSHRHRHDRHRDRHRHHHGHHRHDHYRGHYHGYHYYGHHYGHGYKYGYGHGFYGSKFKYGWYFPGKYHYHWSKRWYSPSYKCWFFYCPRTYVWYYWYAPGVCYYPVTYITCAAPVVGSTPGLVSLDKLPVVPEGEAPVVPAPAGPGGPDADE